MMRRASVLAMVVAAVALCWLTPTHAARRGPKFSGVLKCQSCHEKPDIGDQFGIWSSSAHSQAFVRLASDEAKALSQKLGLGPDPQQLDACLECHTAAFGEPKERIARNYAPEEGVTCEACHGPGSIYRRKKVMLDRDMALENGLIIPTETECMRCHNDRSPSWDPKRYTTADGSQVGFDFELAFRKIAHPVPEGYDPSTSPDD